MLRDRLLSASILVAVVLGCLLVDLWFPLFGAPGIALLPLLLFFAVGTAWELSHLIERSGRLISPRIAVVGGTLAAAAGAVPLLWEATGNAYPPNCPVGRLGWLVIGGMTAVALAFGAEMWTFGRGPKGALERIAAAVMVSIYVGLPFGLLVVVRKMGSEPNWGLAAVLTLIAATKAGDTGAYAVGRAIGRHKLIPRLSPGKTWEGAFGGVALAVLVAYGCFYGLFPAVCDRPPEIPWWGAPVFGLACAVSGMFGDLAESLIKRDSGVKDSGGLLPGMGGVWDVTDSLIGASVPAFVCFAAGAAGACT